MAEILKPDICVIGAGSGGLSVAAAAAAFGVPVVLIERGKMGGDCLNYGCVPSKALIAAAKRAARRAQRARLRRRRADRGVDFAKVHDHVHGVIAAIAPIDSEERFTGLGVRVIAGTARFKDQRTVTVGDNVEIKRAALRDRDRLVAGDAADSRARPRRRISPTRRSSISRAARALIVIGGGPVGLELAQAFRRLGSEVTVLEAATPLAKDDPECAAVVLDALEREGVVIRSGVKVVRVAQRRPAYRSRSSGATASETIEGSAPPDRGRPQADVDGLELEAAGIAITTAPASWSIEQLQTTNKRVYAIGDVAGGQLQFTHVANDHAGIVIRHALFRLPVRDRRRC